jgi:hypothetical protein
VTHDRRVLVVLDDAHSLAQITPLLPGAPTCGVLVTSRSRLAGLNGAVHADLEVFDETEAIELLSRVIGHDRVAAERETARELVVACVVAVNRIGVVGTGVHRPADQLMCRRNTSVRPFAGGPWPGESGTGCCLIGEWHDSRGRSRPEPRFARRCGGRWPTAPRADSAADIRSSPTLRMPSERLSPCAAVMASPTWNS